MFQTDKLKDYAQRFKKSPYFLPVLLVLGGVVLLIFSGNPEETKVQTESLDPYEYTEQLEKKLEKSITEFSFVEKCSVMITLSSLENNEYLENSSVTANNGETSEQYSRQDEYLVINEGGNDNVIVETKKTPKICGVLVVYKGEDDIESKKSILEAASTVLGLQSNKVCVISE